MAMIRNKAIEKVEYLIKANIKDCKFILKALGKKQKLTKKDEEKKELYEDMVVIFEEILAGDSMPTEFENKYDKLLGSVCTLLNMLEDGTYTVKQAIEESEIRKCI